jgi:hypothetical protein
MPTAGYTAEPDYGSEWWGSGVENQHCSAVTMPEAGRITRIGVWLRGKDASCSFRGVVWNSTRNTVLGQTALQTASGAALAIGASSKYEAAVTTPFDVAAGTIYVGFTRNPTGAMQFGFDNTGSHYDDDNGSSNPSGMSGESSHSSRRMGVYVVYEVGSETFVRRSGAWVKAEAVQVRRSGAWSDVGPDVYVRRGGVWVKA